MIFDVTGRQAFFFFAFNVLAFKFLKELCRILAQYIDQHIQATAMCHPDNHVFNACRTRTPDQFAHDDNKAFPTFERKTFLTDIT